MTAHLPEMTESLWPSQKSAADSSWVPPNPVTRVSPHDLGCVSEVMILDSQCGLLACKRSLQNIPYRKAAQLFAKHIKAVGGKNLVPYFREEDVDIFYLSKNDIFIVAARPSPKLDTAVSPVICLDFLQRVYEVLKDVVGFVNEPYVAVNKMLVFEVLDQMLTSGYSFLSSYAEMKAQLSLTLIPIKPKIAQLDELGSRFFGIYSTDSVKASSASSQMMQKGPNSVYLNIVEGLSAVLGPDGQVISSELWGKLTLISTLDRPAPILIQLNPDLVVQTSQPAGGQVAGASHMENPSFHPCVDLSQWALGRRLRVFPPADQTRLMMYTLSDPACIQLPVVLLPTLAALPGSRDHNLTLRLINQAEHAATASFVRVRVQIPSCVSSVSTTKSGDPDSQSSQFNLSERYIEWQVNNYPAGAQSIITFRLIINTDLSLDLTEIGPISIAFNMKRFSASGLMVQSASLEGSSTSVDGLSAACPPAPEFFFGVSTKAVSYTLRTNLSQSSVSNSQSYSKPKQ